MTGLLMATGDRSPRQQAPLPAAFPLFASGLGGMGLFAWWRKRKSALLAPPDQASRLRLIRSNVCGLVTSRRICAWHLCQSLDCAPTGNFAVCTLKLAYTTVS